MRSFPVAAFVALLSVGSAAAADLVVLTDANWERFAPAGKEADAILGDYALRSDRLTAVVGQPRPDRHANMTVRQVGGAVIDLTLVDRPNDQLSAFFPGLRRFAFARAEIIRGRGPSVLLALTAPAKADLPELRVEYELEDGRPFLLVRSVFRNTSGKTLDVPLTDDLRADNFDHKSRAGATDLFYVHDQYFDQAYGIVAERHGMRTRSDIKTSVIEYLPEGRETATVSLPPGGRYELVRRLIPATNLAAIKGEALRLGGVPVVPCGWHLVDPRFRPVAGADVTIGRGDEVYATARSDAWGWVRADLPRERFALTVKAPGRPPLRRDLDLTSADATRSVHTEYPMEEMSAVAAVVTDEQGQPTPCKVAFKGIGGTASPNWGPPSASPAVVNLYYSADGRFVVPINEGTYEVVVSRGPAFDVVRRALAVERGKTTALTAVLRRAFATPGWRTTDFHSHSSPSGDNTSDQRGRVLNLLAEEIEFAPCTEHNRLDSYVPHLRALGAERFMGTCTGIELTGTPLPLNHQNAFPLVLRPRAQDGGGPTTDADPATQVRRLAAWDEVAEKFVQQNHPDLGWLYYDKDGDGVPDSGHRGGFAFLHATEVHPIDDILDLNATRVGTEVTSGRRRSLIFNNTAFNWLQLLNQGVRLPGVVNTDAHYNFHGSGGLRNYVRCDAATPGAIDPLEIVRHAKRGHIVMSTAPFLDVRLGAARPGDDVRLDGGKGRLDVQVFCANWYDVDRVQVLVNGKPEPTLNFTRKSHPHLFRDGPRRFAHGIDVALKGDAHLIVVVVGEDADLGDVMGPMWGKYRPAAVSNPIFVDVDGGGFRANGDTLGSPLPVKGGKPAGG